MLPPEVVKSADFVKLDGSYEEEGEAAMSSRSTAFLVLTLMLISFLVVATVGCGGSKDAESPTSTGAETAVAPGAASAATDGAGPGTAGSTGTTNGGNVSPTTTRTPVGKSGVLEIGGLVDNPVTLSVADVKKMRVETVMVEDASGKSEQYQGVRLSELFKLVKVRGEASRVAMTAHADGYVVELSLQDIYWSPDSLLALTDEGRFDIVIPGFDRSAWVNDAVKIEFR